MKKATIEIIFDAILALIAKNKKPTYTAIAAKAKKPVTTINYYMQRLFDTGRIKRDKTGKLIIK